MWIDGRLDDQNVWSSSATGEPLNMRAFIKGPGGSSGPGGGKDRCLSLGVGTSSLFGLVMEHPCDDVRHYMCEYEICM